MFVCISNVKLNYNAPHIISSPHPILTLTSYCIYSRHFLGNTKAFQLPTGLHTVYTHAHTHTHTHTHVCIIVAVWVWTLYM